MNTTTTPARAFACQRGKEGTDMANGTKTTIETATMYTARGATITVTRHATYAAALRSMTAAQRKLYSATVWALPGGGYDLFPLGHPVPAGAHLTYGPAWQESSPLSLAKRVRFARSDAR